jgi:hypothetical protein
MKSFNYKFQGMHKTQEFVVYPALPTDREISIQSNSTYARFDRVTGIGRINRKGSNYKTSYHLLTSFGGKDFICPKECIELAENCLNNNPNIINENGQAVEILLM